MRIRRLAVIAAAVAALAVPVVVAAGPVSAETPAPRSAAASEQRFIPVGVAIPGKRATGSGFQYYYDNAGNSARAYPNSWSGGPWVNVFSSTTPNNDFTVIQNPQSGFQMIKRTNGSGGNACIGDALNDPSDARASEDSCGSPIGVGNGWGTDWIVSSGGPCPAGQWWFQNKHWSSPNNNGYLGPADNYSNGDHFYLNKPLVICFARQVAS